VEAGRGERLVKDDKLYSGLIWNGEQALEKGLVDGLGSAGYVAREVIQQEKMYDYTVRPTPFEEFSKKFGVAVGRGVGLALNAAFGSSLQLR
jgi:protease IV